MLPMSWISEEDWKDLGDGYEDFCSKEHTSFGNKKKAIETELNRRGLEWRQYSDEERDCLWSLHNLIGSDDIAKSEEIKEFHRLVKANGNKVPRLKFSPSERTKLQLEAIGLIADWTRDDEGHAWVEIKGLKEAA